MMRICSLDKLIKWLLSTIGVTGIKRKHNRAKIENFGGNSDIGYFRNAC